MAANHQGILHYGPRCMRPVCGRLDAHEVTADAESFASTKQRKCKRCAAWFEAARERTRKADAGGQAHGQDC